MTLYPPWLQQQASTVTVISTTPYQVLDTRYVDDGGTCSAAIVLELRFYPNGTAEWKERR